MTDKKEKAEKTSKAKTKKPKKVEALAAVYRPHETYEVGQKIKHPVWGEEGKVKSVTETPEGFACIIVDFGKELGKRRLIVDYSLKL